MTGDLSLAAGRKEVELQNFLLLMSMHSLIVCLCPPLGFFVFFQRLLSIYGVSSTPYHLSLYILSITRAIYQKWSFLCSPLPPKPKQRGMAMMIMFLVMYGYREA